jgi:hypothetical protein
MDDQNQQGVAIVIKTMISSKSDVQNTGSRSGIQRELAPHVYQENVGKKDQGRALSDEGSTPLLSSKDDLAVADAAAMAVSEDKRTCKAPSK